MVARPRGPTDSIGRRCGDDLTYLYNVRSECHFSAPRLAWVSVGNWPEAAGLSARTRHRCQRCNHYRRNHGQDCEAEYESFAPLAVMHQRIRYGSKMQSLHTHPFVNLTLKALITPDRPDLSAEPTVAMTPVLPVQRMPIYCYIFRSNIVERSVVVY